MRCGTVWYKFMKIFEESVAVVLRSHTDRLISESIL
jgi:hypothetical protein